MELVKKLLIIKSTPNYIIRAKTGWATMENKNIGWYVGYVEKSNDKYIFVLNVESEKEDPSLFIKSREGITRNILSQLRLI